MATKRYPPDDPREWFNRAHSNLARAVTAGVYLEDLCFDAQQAVEKAIKAVFLHRQINFPYTHEINRLLLLLENSGLKIPKFVRRSEKLTKYAVFTRYPGMAKRVTEREHQASV